MALQAYQPGQVKQAAVPGVRVQGINARANPDDFGAGAARQLQQVGAVVGDYANEQRVKMIKAQVRDSLNNAEAEAQSLLQAVQGMQGKEAGMASGMAQDALAKLRSEAAKGIDSKEGVDMFNANFDRVAARTMEYANRHQAAAVDKYEKDTLKASIVLKTKEAAYDPDNMGDAEMDIIANVNALYKSASPEEKELRRMEATGVLISNVVEANGGRNPKGMLELVKSYEGKIDPVLLGRLKGKLEEEDNNQLAWDTAKQIENIPVDQQAIALQNLPAEIVSKVTSYRGILKNQAKAAEDAGVKQEVGNLRKQYEQSGGTIPDGLTFDQRSQWVEWQALDAKQSSFLGGLALSASGSNIITEAFSPEGHSALTSMPELDFQRLRLSCTKEQFRILEDLRNSTTVKSPTVKDMSNGALPHYRTIIAPALLKAGMLEIDEGKVSATGAQSYRVVEGKDKEYNATYRLLNDMISGLGDTEKERLAADPNLMGKYVARAMLSSEIEARVPTPDKWFSYTDAVENFSDELEVVTLNAPSQSTDAQSLDAMIIGLNNSDKLEGFGTFARSDINPVAQEVVRVKNRDISLVTAPAVDLNNRDISGENLEYQPESGVFVGRYTATNGDDILVIRDSRGELIGRKRRVKDAGSVQ